MIDNYSLDNMLFNVPTCFDAFLMRQESAFFFFFFKWEDEVQKRILGLCNSIISVATNTDCNI